MVRVRVGVGVGSLRSDSRKSIHVLIITKFAGNSGPVPYTLHVFNGVKLVFRLSLSLPREIVLITFMHCKAVVRIKVG